MPFPHSHTLTLTASALALALGTIPFATAPALAQEVQPQAEAPQDSQETELAPAYTAEELDAFAAALIDVSGVRQKYAPMVQSAETEEQQEAIIRKANEEMAEAVEATSGMDLASYTEIAEAATQDDTLSARIKTRLKEHGMLTE